MFIGMPVGQHIHFETVAVVADAISVKDDQAVAGIHHAIAADLILPHFL
jgi:hypothetical protein